MGNINVYLAEKDGEVLPFLYLGDIMRHYGLAGLYNVKNKGDKFSYKGVNVERHCLETKYGSNKK